MSDTSNPDAIGFVELFRRLVSLSPNNANGTSDGVALHLCDQ